MINLDYSQIEDVEVDGIDTRDYPDFCDAFIAAATSVIATAIPQFFLTKSTTSWAVPAEHVAAMSTKANAGMRKSLRNWNLLYGFDSHEKINLRF